MVDWKLDDLPPGYDPAVVAATLDTTLGARCFPTFSGFFVQGAVLLPDEYGNPVYLPAGNGEYGFCQADHCEQGMAAAAQQAFKGYPIQIVAFTMNKKGAHARHCGNCRDLMKELADERGNPLFSRDALVLTGHPETGTIAWKLLSDYYFEPSPLPEAKLTSLEEILLNHARPLLATSKEGIYVAVLATEAGRIATGVLDERDDYHPTYPLESSLLDWSQTVGEHDAIKQVLLAANSTLPSVKYRDRQALLLKTRHNPVPVTLVSTDYLRRVQGIASTDSLEWLPYPFTLDEGPGHVQDGRHKTAVFDGDDTLFPCQPVYDKAKLAFLNYLDSKFGADMPFLNTVIQRLEQVDAELWKVMGYSPERFPTSMVETFRYVCSFPQISHKPTDKELRQVREIGRRVFDPAAYRLGEGVEETLDFLFNQDLTLILLTKGDPNVQLSKVDSMGLGRWFGDSFAVLKEPIYGHYKDGSARIIICAEKTEPVYSYLIGDLDPEDFFFIGNDVAKDVKDPLRLGCHGIFRDVSAWSPFKRDQTLENTHRMRIIDRFSDLRHDFWNIFHG